MHVEKVDCFRNVVIKVENNISFKVMQYEEKISRNLGLKEKIKIPQLHLEIMENFVGLK